MGSHPAGPVSLATPDWQQCTVPTVTTRVIGEEFYNFRLGRVASCVWCNDSCLHHCYLDIYRWVQKHTHWQRLERFPLDHMDREQARSLYGRLFEGTEAEAAGALTQLFLR